MEGFDLARIADRLAVAERVFSYPTEPHRRKHEPKGYGNYESYRDWLRDEFSYRCVFSLVREQWVDKVGNFDIDHLQPRASRPELTCDYNNLLYVAHRVNLIRGKRNLPDPCQIAIGKCLRIEPAGDRMGEVEALNDSGKKIIGILRLDSEDATAYRRKWIGILRAVAHSDETLFRQFVGYPKNLPDLSLKRVERNGKPSGLDDSAHELRRLGRLPEWY